MGRNMDFDLGKTVVLAMDCQSGIVSQYTKPHDGFIERCGSVLRAARAAGLLVVHVQIGFRPGLPEVGGRNKLFAGIKASPQRRSSYSELRPAEWSSRR